MKKKGFTLVELLAVIIILAIILVIAVPKINNAIQADKEKSLFLSAKSILRNLDYDNIESDYIEKTSLSMLDIKNLSSEDYDINNSYAYMINNVLYIDLIGINKYENMALCHIAKSDNDYIIYNTCGELAPTTLAINTDGGMLSDSPTGTYVPGAKIVLTNPIRENCIFTGWTVETGNSKISGNNLIIGTTSTTIKANWISNVILAVDLDGGTLTETIAGTYLPNENIELKTPSKSNYIFSNWFVEKGNSIISRNTITIGTENTIIKANWTKISELTINLNGGVLSFDSQGIYALHSQIDLGIPTRENYEFSGWEVISGNSIVSGNTLFIGSQDTTVEAKWKFLSYSISYELNGGTISGEYPTTYNKNIGETLVNPTKPGHTFLGWTGSNGDTASTLVTIARGSTGNKSYTANWIEIKNYDYTGGVQIFTVPITGLYKIELWGAQGGSGNSSAGGKGGYTSGRISLQSGEILYIYIGSKGNSGVVGKSATCPFNGGGNGGTRNYSSEGESGAGGGATDIRCFSSNNLCIANTTNLDWFDIIGLNSRIMVAGAGGGGANFANAASGGNAGGITGANGNLNAGSNSHTLGVGGKQTMGGSSASSGGTRGSFGNGGNGQGTSYGAGGGSGYYGGGTGGSVGGGVSSGAGGSSYISGYTGCVAVTSSGALKPNCGEGTTDSSCSIHFSNKVFSEMEMKAGNEEMLSHNSNSTMFGNEGNGYAKITFIE